MSKQEKTIGAYFTHELVIERSRFITHLAPTDTPEEARAFINEISKQHADATHNCTAYVIQHDTTIQKANDDGEPSGTAGMPMLQALLKKDMVNITAVVTRYFGGIKLGAGGLIRAYSGAVSEALNKAPLMIYTTFLVVQLTITYDELNKLYYLQDVTQDFLILTTDYAEQIIATISLKEETLQVLQQKFVETLLRTIDFTVLNQEIRKTSI